MCFRDSIRPTTRELNSQLALKLDRQLNYFSPAAPNPPESLSFPANRLTRSWQRSQATLFCLLAFCLSLANQVTAQQVQYNRDVRPILSENCFACHGFDNKTREAGLRLDTHEGATNTLDSGEVAVMPHQLAESELITRILSTDDDIMPPADSGKRLSTQQVDVLRRWVEQGGEYEKHWAFIAPKKTSPPGSSTKEHQASDVIDAFVRERLEREGLSPSPEAAPETLIRRISLDLIGLPPTLAEVDDFLAACKDDANLAISELVDRLLRSPHYGERWGRWWLDQARYADSNGYSIDAPRQIWLYRDWVVDALNRDLPFDKFTIEQLAGDLLPQATTEQIVATGFHRNTQINQEGGIDPEQFRIDSVIDRVATTGSVWLGLTVGCAQCHNHKFDPIEQKEYYQFFAFFNNQEEPNLKVDDVSTMVMKELATPRQTTIFIQGDFTRPAEPVSCDTPSVLHPLEKSAATANRLDLARWLVDPANPLTARVIVNRVWQQYFGRGIVETENDFGLQGSLPSHPELLDWLAVDFMEQGWSLKKLHRQIVCSQTYRQSSQLTPALQQHDPQNYLLARQRRLRLDAELVRDVGLAVSGLLSSRLGGPPVYPPIPAGIMSLGQSNRSWKESQGEERFRRGLYTFVYRATPPPSLSVFDAPEGFSTCTRRARSNTPLQALTLMNDSGFVEFARALQKIIEDEGIETAFRRCTARHAKPDEIAILKSLDSMSAARALLNLDETFTRE